MNMKMRAANLQHLTGDPAQGDHILVPRDGHADDPQEGSSSHLQTHGAMDRSLAETNSGRRTCPHHPQR